MPTRRATRKSRGGEYSGGELSGGSMASRVRLANLARGRAVRAANIMKTRAKGGLLLVPYKHKDPKTGKLTMRKGPDPVKEKGLYLRNAKRLFKWIKQVDPDGEGEDLNDITDLLADPTRLLRIDNLYESEMQETRGKRTPAAKAKDKAKRATTAKTITAETVKSISASIGGVKHTVPPIVSFPGYLQTDKYQISKMGIGSLKPELQVIVGELLPFLVDIDDTNNPEELRTMIGFLRKFLPKVPRSPKLRLIYRRILDKLKEGYEVGDE